MTNQVTAKLHDIGGAGGLIDAASAAAGDAVRVQQLSFSIDDDSVEPGTQELTVMVKVIYGIDQ